MPFARENTVFSDQTDTRKQRMTFLFYQNIFFLASIHFIQTICSTDGSADSRGQAGFGTSGSIKCTKAADLYFSLYHLLPGSVITPS